MTVPSLFACQRALAGDDELQRPGRREPTMRTLVSTKSPVSLPSTGTLTVVPSVLPRSESSAAAGRYVTVTCAETTSPVVSVTW